LYYPITNRWDAQRSLSAIRLRYINP
jgi:hypothetical protein